MHGALATVRPRSGVERKRAIACGLDVGVIYTGEDAFMDQLVPSLARSIGDLSAQLILVDNASGRDVSAWDAYLTRTTVLHNDRRLSYAANLNRVLDASTAPYVLLLNTDMYFDPDEQCLAKMVEFMDDNPDCGVAGCRLYRGDGSYAFPARRFQSLSTIAARRLRLGKLLAAEVDRYLYKDRDPHSTFACDWLSGCFLLVRREAFRDVGHLDAGYRKYFEDVDYCRRMTSAGWRVMFHGETYCYHLEQRGSAKLFSRDAVLHLRSYGRYLRKWGFESARGLRPVKTFLRGPVLDASAVIGIEPFIHAGVDTQPSSVSTCQ